MDFNRNLRIVRTSDSSYPFPYKSNVLWVHHDENNNPVSEIWDHGKWVPVTGIGSGSGDVIIDTKMSDSSSNAIANKTVKKYVDGIASKTDASILSLNEGVAELKLLIDNLNSGYRFMGVATPETNPGTPDQNVFYIANGKGTYTNFGGIQVTEDEVVILYYDTAWHKVSTGIASQEKLSELEGTLNGEESQQSVDVDTSVHAYVSTSGVKTNTSSTSVSLFEYNLNKGERVKVIGQANANWALLSVKVSENNYTPIVIGDAKVGQTGEYTATEDCTIAFNFWNNEDYSFVKYSRSRGLVETVNKNKEDIADNITRVSSLERIVNDGDWKEKTDIDTSNHKYIKTDGSTQTTSATSVSLAEFQLSAGNSIRVQGVANTTWSFLSKKVSDINYTPIAIGAGKSQTEEYTAEDDCIVAFCFFNSSPYSVYIKEGGLSSMAEVLNSKVDSIIPRVKTLEESCLRKRIEVKKSGGDYNSVTEAINYANSLGGVIDIYIYDGVYDVYAEQGGDAWIATISHSQGERQGLHLADNVNLYGVGHVELRFELPDNITYDQSRSVSCLNLWNSNTIENIDFYAKNCRYAIHDETDGGKHNIKRVVKNCRLEHLGSADGLWQSPTAMGGGASGGSQYDWINCQFITHKFFQAFSYHTNHNETPSHFNIDGCVGLCLEYTGVEPVRSFCAQYYGENHIGKSIFNFKNCTGNGDVVKRAQTADSVDHIEVYNNAYNKITL